MNKKQSYGVVIIIVSIIFLVGAVIDAFLASHNEQVYEENKIQGIEDRELKETIDFQWKTAIVCSFSFVIFFIGGAFFFITSGNKEERS